MSSFTGTLLKGLYTPYLFFVVLGVASAMAARRWRSFDTLLLAAFLAFEFFAAVQVRIFYGEWKTNRRYMWIALPLYLPFAVQGMKALWNVLKKTAPGRWAALVLCLFLVVNAVYGVYHPVFRMRLSREKRISRAITRRTAEWIRRDWDAAAAPAGPRAMRCDRYQSGKRPLVRSETWEQVGYLCGGQAYTDFLARQGERPDYIVTPDRDAVFPDHVPAGTVSEEGREAYIHKLRRADR